MLRNVKQKLWHILDSSAVRLADKLATDVDARGNKSDLLPTLFLLTAWWAIYLDQAYQVYSEMIFSAAVSPIRYATACV